MSTYSNLKFELITTGEQTGTWGATTNSNIGTAIEQAIVGKATLVAADFTGNIATLTLSNSTALQNARALCLVIDPAAISGAATVNVPAIQKPYIVINNGNYPVTVKVAGQTGVTVPASNRTVVYNDGTDVGVQITYLPSLNLNTPLPISAGGTSGGNAAQARSNLGASNVGESFFTLADPGSVSYVQINADNSITTMDAATFRAAIGAGTGGGGVSSVGGTGTVNGITLSGVVTSTGNLTLGGALSNVSLTTQVTGTLPIANGGTGAVTQQAALNTLAGSVTSGYYLRGNGTNVVMATLQAADFPTLNQNTTGTAANVTGVVAIANGGTGAATQQAALNAVAGAVTSGSFLRGNGTNVTMSTIQVSDVPTLNQNTTGTAANITATTNSTLTTLSSLSLPGSQVSGNISGNATNVTGTVAIANGGSGQTTAQAAMNAFAGAVTSGSYLRGNGTNVTMSTIQAGDVPTLNQNTTGSAGSVATTNWTVVESGGYLYFKNGGVNKMRLDSSGNLVCSGNITAYGTI